MTLKDFAKKYNLDASELLELLIFEGFPIQDTEDEIDTRLVNYLLEYTSKKTKNKKNKLENENTLFATSRKTGSPEGGKKKTAPVPIEKVITVESMSLSSLSTQSGLSMPDCILYFIKRKKLYSVNHILTKEEVIEFAEAQNIKTTLPPSVAEKNFLFGEKKQHTKNKKDRRNPVIVITGHVDHGKTTLLDTIRKKAVAASEKGGITQHVGAYEVKYQNNAITFLDTPGHEAFTSLRMRGVTIADIGILVIAADDGIKPQTIESIKMLQKMNLHIIVAITKIDKIAQPNYDTIFSELTKYGITPEAWGGDIPVVPLSAKTETGIVELLETIHLCAEVNEITTDLSALPTGYVLETRTEKGRGFVANILLEQGVLEKGDTFYAGSVWGKVNSAYDSEGASVSKLFPGRPYVISGFDEMPAAGEILLKASLKEAKEMALKNKFEGMKKDVIVASDKKTYPIIVKCDVISSLQAVNQKISLYQEDKTNFYFPVVLFGGIGDLTEHDLTMSMHTHAAIYLFNVKQNFTAKMKEIIKKNDIKIYFFDIIYHLLEDIEAEIKEEKNKKAELKKIGEILVLKLFQIKGVGKIIGFKVTDGIIKQGATGVVLRNKIKIGEGIIKTLQKEKNACKELSKGNEGAFNMPSFQDINEGDTIQIFTE
jgi:translation initiation factor IF-2